MGRKPRVDRSPEEKWQIVQEGIKSGNVSETCRRQGIAPNLFYRWKDEAEQGAKAALGGRSAAAAETEKDHRIRQLERTLGRKSLEIEILKTSWGSELRCGSFPGAGDDDAGLHSHIGSGDTGHQPVESLLPKEAARQPGRSAVRRTDRRGVRGKTRVWISPRDLVAAKKRKPPGESQTCPAGDARTWVAGALPSSAGSQEERVGPCGGSRAESDLAVGHDEDLGGAGSGLGVSGVRDRLLHAGDRGLESLAPLPNRRCTGCGRASRPGTASLGQP